MTSAPPVGARARDDIRVARVHLRMGQLTLARAELEDLLRQDRLDLSGMAMLAEVRWRTGDGEGASDAAKSHLEAGGEDEIAICIAAESVAADGRTSEARALMDRLPVADAATLDALFAGMPRRAFWPAGPVDRSDLDDLRRHGDGRIGSVRRAAPSTGRIGERPPPATRGRAGEFSPGRAVPSPREVIEAATLGGWDAGTRRSLGDAEVAAGRPTPAGSRPTPAGQAHPGRRAKGELDPAAELDRAREELGTKPERALLRLSLVLRHDPTFAPVVLQLLHLRREPEAALVRGDAQRLLGRHLEAEAAFDAAAESLEVP
jgi:hypothetical protein